MDIQVRKEDGELTEEFLQHRWDLRIDIQKKKTQVDAAVLAVGSVGDHNEKIDRAVGYVDELRELLEQYRHLKDSEIESANFQEGP